MILSLSLSLSRSLFLSHSLVFILLATSAVDIAFATAEVRDEISTFLTGTLIDDAVLFAGDALHAVDVRLVALNLVRKLQAKNFLRRLTGREWVSVLKELVLTSLRESTREDLWFSAVSVCTASDATVRALLLSSPTDAAADLVRGDTSK